MSKGLIALGLIILFMLGGLLAFWRNAKLPLPKNLPPPLPDDDDEDEQ